MQDSGHERFWIKTKETSILQARFRRRLLSDISEVSPHGSFAVHSFEAEYGQYDRRPSSPGEVLQFSAI